MPLSLFFLESLSNTKEEEQEKFGSACHFSASGRSNKLLNLKSEQ